MPKLPEELLLLDVLPVPISPVEPDELPVPINPVDELPVPIRPVELDELPVPTSPVELEELLLEPAVLEELLLLDVVPAEPVPEVLLLLDEVFPFPVPELWPELPCPADPPAYIPIASASCEGRLSPSTRPGTSSGWLALVITNSFLPLKQTWSCAA